MREFASGGYEARESRGIGRWKPRKDAKLKNAGQEVRAVTAAGYFGAPGLLGGVSLAR